MNTNNTNCSTSHTTPFEKNYNERLLQSKNKINKGELIFKALFKFYL